MARLSRGFTLLEVMMVIVIIGIMASMLIPTLRGQDFSQDLEVHAKRFDSLFTLAAEYALLNNLELGLLVEDNFYEFYGFDGQRWQPLDSIDKLERVEFSEPFSIRLNLEDLPIEPQIGIEAEDFEERQEEFYLDEEEEPVFPQIYILSGGDITPFQLIFTFDDGFDAPIYFIVSAGYTLPLSTQGPLDDLP
ncbi:type II secretion system protein GspH [Thalassotalea litorea]|uniref:Type II secretion system protein H n=1 Tax=Thalassotalea litorea TaxID=2020715 RepID=A0A5R9IR99_9GAMM|nr:type II secretion system minor pseudopilin GspH [Thalassotalea litorea]TLU65821.1 type II secretion system protein GspH [Thalassotalea litorea]